jgi:cell division septation protein DedD
MRMMFKTFLGISVGLMTAGGKLHAQPGIVTDPVFLRAQTLVSDGEGAAGRTLVDSVLNASTPGTPRYAEALYWRALLAASSTTAERDYKLILVDYPLSPRVEDVLLRLAQLESTRGDKEGAQKHLERLILEYPEGKLRAKASYWLGRVLFDRNETAKACQANADAAARTPATDFELKNQIEYQSKRCTLALRTATAKDSAAKRDSMTRVADSIRTDSISTRSKADSLAADTTRGVRKSKGMKDTASTETAKRKTGSRSKASEVKKDSASVKKDSISSSKADSAKAISERERTRDSSSTGEDVTGSKKPVMVFSIQVGAYSDRKGAEALAKRLRAQQYKVYVSDEGAPYRVRVGTYTTHVEAAKAVKILKNKGLKGFVVQMEAR